MDFNKLESRYRAIEQELLFAQRKREEEAKNAARLLGAINDDMAVQLREYIPAIDAIRSYTEDDIIRNNNHEIETLQETYSLAASLLDQWLTQLEEAIK